MSIKIEGFPPSTAGITGGLIYRGTLDPSSPPANITSAKQGDYYVVNATGTLAGVELTDNDHILFNQDASSPLTSAMFDKIDNTEPAASETVAGIIEIATNAEAGAATATNKALVPSNISSINTSDLNNDAGFISSVASASETVAGVIEIATNAEATTGTATDKALVPSNLSSVGTSQLNNDAGFITSVASASETVAGKIEIATNAEATAGTATDKALVPSNISSIDLSQLDEISYTAGAAIDGKFLKYVDSNGQWEAADVPTAAAASETVAGVIEIATNAEATAGTATDKALVPSNLSSVGTSQLNNDAGFITSFSETDTLDSVVGRGSTTTTSITTGGLTVTGDIDPNTDDTYYIGNEDARFISYYGDMNGAIRFKAKVDQTGGLDAGEVVYINGVSGTVPTVAKAQANASSTMPAFGLVYADANDTADVEIITFGNLTGLDTSLLTLNSTLYVSSSTAGGLTTTPPTGESNLIQNIGFVVRSDNGSGIIKVGGAGRTNATPNLDQDKVFLGNASNQAVATALSSINLSSFNNDSGFITDIAAASETVAGKIEIATNAEATAGTATDKALVPSNISSIDFSQLDEVSYTAGAAIDGKFLKYVDSNGQWEAADVPTTAAASETVAGVIEIATNAEATAGTATDKALVPSNLSSIGTSQLNNDAAFITDIAAASETVAGKIEIATNAEATAGTATDKALVPSNISSIDFSQLDEVSYTAGSGIDNYVLTYVDSNGQWEAKVSSISPPSVTTDSSGTDTTLSAKSGNEEVHLISNGASAVTITINSASSVASGFKYQIKRLGTANVTVKTATPSTDGQIDSSDTYVIANQNESVTLVSDGSDYFII